MPSNDRWRDYARCAGENLNLMFPELPGRGCREKEVERLRQEFCWRCPVRAECLRDGMIEEFGIWGGLTPEDRRTVSQLTCHCGADIDPLDMLDRNRRHFCRNCAPIVFDRSSKLGTQ